MQAQCSLGWITKLGQVSRVGICKRMETNAHLQGDNLL